MRATAVSAAIVMNVLVRAADLSLSYTAVWPDLPHDVGLMPIRVEIKNSGPDTAGLLKVKGSSGSMAYPVELPRGADKILTVYMAAQGFWGSGTLELETPAGKQTVEVETRSTVPQGTRCIGAICSSLGVLSNLAPATPNSRDTRGTACLPSLAPERSVGYLGMSAIVLADGSEMVSDAAVLAIQRYVLEGGTLLVVGGPSAPWLRDTRWAKYLPVVPASTRAIPTVTALSKLEKEPIKGPLSVSVGRPKSGATTTLSQDGTPLIVERQMGLGKVVFWAFDPFAEPVRTWAGQKGLFKKLVRSREQVNKYLGISHDDEDGRFRGRYFREVELSPNDPFSVHMPAAWKMALILLGFIVVVIPVNFIVLQSVKRREWAWLSIPVISLAFSGLIFATAQGLYSTETARSTNGVVIAHDGIVQAVFVGQQQLFLPKAGVFDLGFHDVESAQNSDDRRSRRGDPTDLAKVPELFDVGQVVAPRLQASNLTFRSFDLVQVVDVPGRIAFNPKIKGLPGEWSVKGKLTNATPWKLRDAMVVYGVSSAVVGDIDPGQSVVVNVRIPKQAGQRWSARVLPSLGTAIGLEAQVSGPAVGTHLGTETVGRDRSCRLLYTWDVGVVEI